MINIIIIATASRTMGCLKDLYTMMTYILFLIMVSKTTLAANEFANDFEVLKMKYGKIYDNEEDEEYHRGIFLSNKAYIDKFNADTSNAYTLGINEFADLDPAIFAKQHNRYLGHLDQSNNNKVTYFKPTVGLEDLPESIDWREKGVVTKVKDQGHCGSCWAFSTTGSLEGQHALKTGKLVSLSEQQLLDCSDKEGNHGCNGGLMTKAFNYIKQNGGEDTEISYPYKARKGKCRFDQNSVGANCTGYIKIEENNCKDLKIAIATIGPISAAMDASEFTFLLYNGGIYKPAVCSSTMLDHGVLAVGYGTENGTDYWLVKNSYGTSWGMEGYFKIAAEDNLCGICTQASYPTV